MLLFVASTIETIGGRLFLQMGAVVFLIVVVGIFLTEPKQVTIEKGDLVVRSRLRERRYPVKRITEVMKFFQLKMYTDGPATGVALIVSTDTVQRKQIFALHPRERNEFEQLNTVIKDLKRQNKKIRVRSQIQRGFEIVNGQVYWLDNGEPGKKADFGPIKDEYQWFFGRNVF